MKYLIVSMMIASSAFCSLINPPAPSPVPPTTAQAQAQVKALVKGVINQDLKVMQQSFQMVGRALWANPSLQPADAFAALGTDCAQMLQVSDAFIPAVNGIAAGAIADPTPAGWTVSAAKDGSCSVTPPAPLSKGK